MKPAERVVTVSLCHKCSWNLNPKKVYYNHVNHPPRKRAGVVLYSNKHKKLLIVQVYNRHLGLPKGGQEDNESLEQTAVRELHEETGLKISPSLLTQRLKYKGRAHYFFVDADKLTDTNLQIHEFKGNDVTGTGWVHLDCINKINGEITADLHGIIQEIRTHYDTVIHKRKRRKKKTVREVTVALESLTI